MQVLRGFFLLLVSLMKLWMTNIMRYYASTSLVVVAVGVRGGSESYLFVDGPGATEAGLGLIFDLFEGGCLLEGHLVHFSGEFIERVFLF